MSNESHPSPTGSSSSSLFGGGSSNTAGVGGPSPSKTWAQILNSNPSTPSNASNSASSTTNNAANAASTGHPAASSGTSGNTRGISPSSSSPSSQHSTTTTTSAAQPAGPTSTTRSISPSQVTPNLGAFNFSGSRSGFMPNFHDSQSQQQQQSQMNWPLNFNQSSSSSSWMMDDDTQRHLNLAGSSSQQSLDSNHNTAGDGDGFDRLETSSPSSEWGKPVSTNNSTANGWSSFQQTHGNPSRSNAVGNNNNNNTSNQWPEINNFYGTNSSTGVPFNLSQNNNDNNSASSTWQDSSSGNSNDTLGLATNSSNSSVINKHKASSTAAMAVSLTGALKSAIAYGGVNVDSTGGNNDPNMGQPPQPKLVEQLGWDEPEIKVNKRANFDDGTSIWGDPMESMSVQVKKWTNGTKAALTNSTNTILQQPSAIVQKPVSSNVQTSNSGTSALQMTSNDENWPKQQSPTLPQQSSSQWNDPTALSDRGTPPPPTSHQSVNYRPQQSAPTGWNSQPQQSGQQDERFLDGVIDTSGWGLQGAPNKTPFDPYEGRIDPSSWGIQGAGGGGGGGPGNNMGGPLPMNRNRIMADYDLSEGTHDPHSMHRMSSYENQPMTDPYRQGSDLKSPIIGIGGLLPATGNAPPPHHMMPPSQLPFAPRPGSHYQPGNMMRQMNPNGISAPSGAIMGTGGLISPKLSTTSPVPNQAPYVPLAAKQGNIPTPSSQTPTPQQQQQQGVGNSNNGAVHAQIMQQFRLAVQAGLISQDLLNTKLPPFMLQLLQKLFELQQKYQGLTVQLADFSKHKQRFPITFFQTEYDRLTKAITQKRQEMLIVQKQIQEAHAKLVQQQQPGSSSASSQMMPNGPGGPNQSSSGGSAQSQDQLADRLQQSLNVDQSRLHQWTKQQTSTRGGPSSSSMFAPPGLSQKDWQTSSNNPNENWENTQTNDSNNPNPMSNIDAHNSQASSGAFGDPLSDFVDDTDGPPPFVPGQLWNWKSTMHSAEDDPHVTPSSFTMGPKGPSSSMNNLNVGGVDSAFSHPQLLHQMQRRSQSQWQNDQQGFQPSMNDWGKPQQYRGSSKPQQSLNHPPPSHSSFGGYRPYMQ